MRSKFIIPIILFLSCISFVSAQEKKDSLYYKIEEFSDKRKSTKFIHRFIFRREADSASVASRTIEPSKDLYEGKIIRTINIETIDPFGYEKLGKNAESKWYDRVADKIHIDSKKATISNYLLFKKGEEYNVQKIYESERVLRSMSFVNRVNISIIENESKNDSIDAKGLSKMGAEQCLDLWQPMGTFFYQLRLLTRQHQNVVELKTVLKNQLTALGYAMHQSEDVVKQLQQTIELFESQSKELITAIKNHLKSDENVAAKVDNLLKMKGLGVITLATILAETNGFNLFQNYKQLVSYAGYDVVEAQSGTRIGKTKISKKGNSRIRRALHMPSLVVINSKVKKFKDLFDRTYEKHGIKMKSYVAVQKKLLVMIYHLWKKNEEYNSDYEINIQEKEQELSSLYAFEKSKKIAPNKLRLHKVNFQ